jgi:hypothetical protein
MALEKEKTIKALSLNYWKVINVRVNYVTGKTEVTLGLYGDADCRADSASNFYHCESVTFDGVDHTRADLYGFIKMSVIVDEQETNFFVDALDV